jgi:hypothetical protein
MSTPRHLWSGDWRQESSAHAEDLAARRGQIEKPVEAERPVAGRPASRRAAPWRQAARMLMALSHALRAGSGRRIRATGVVVSLTVLSAGAAYVVTSLVVRVMGGA